MQCILRGDHFPQKEFLDNFAEIIIFAVTASPVSHFLP